MTVRSETELEGLREVGRLVAEAIAHMRAHLAEGITTAELDDIGANYLRQRGARSAPQLAYDFPGFNCISVNDVIVHGIPDQQRITKRDVVTLDVTAELDGLIADAARTIPMPDAPPVAQRMVRSARRAFRAALASARPGARVRVIGREIEKSVTRDGFAIVRELCGHGLGRKIHEEPSVPNYDDPRATSMLHDGLVLAVEPMISERPTRVVEDDDGWTLRTADGRLSVHYENTIVINGDVPIVLTASAA
jgi:methionyl aminopeptidase